MLLVVRSRIVVRSAPWHLSELRRRQFYPHNRMTSGDATLLTYCRTQRGSSRPAGLALIPTQAARKACIC
jgi:hypothetical protein